MPIPFSSEETMLDVLRAKINEAIAAHVTHGETLAQLKAAVDAEAARVPTLDDVKQLVARIV